MASSLTICRKRRVNLNGFIGTIDTTHVHYRKKGMAGIGNFFLLDNVFNIVLTTKLNDIQAQNRCQNTVEPLQVSFSISSLKLR